MKEKIVVLDFGGQYNELIARRIRDLGVYSEVLRFDTPLTALSDPSIIGIVLSGGPQSVYLSGAPLPSKGLFAIGKPILGICYGAQAMAYLLGGKVEPGAIKEYGATKVRNLGPSPLFEGIPESHTVFMSHGDLVSVLPEGFKRTSESEETANASFENPERHLYGLQYHPEAEHSVEGKAILRNFVYRICKAKGEWTMDHYIGETVRRLQEETKGKEVLLGLSGGVDSAVTAALLSKAIGKRLICVFVDHGLLRKGEAEEVISYFGDPSKADLHFLPVDARKRFLSALKGVVEPEEKRKIIGKTFVECFDEERKKLGKELYLAQGTIYPDRIESGLGLSAKIKSHHNVGGLPKDLDFLDVVEPLRDLFKDEVREVGKKLGLPASIIHRQPFPGPGLAIRIVGEVTEEKIRIVQEADAIFRSRMKDWSLEAKSDQYFVALSNMRSVGVKGDQRSYEYAAVIRAVSTDDFMSAIPSELPYAFLRAVSEEICNAVPGINRILFDYTSKPPATIELE